MRRAEIYFKDHLAGILIETESGYEFRYNKEYLVKPVKPLFRERRES